MASYDPDSPAYKKAYKHYLRSTAKSGPDTTAWSTFRFQEKRYKSRFPRPTLDDVLDLAPAINDTDALMKSAGWSCGSLSAAQAQCRTLSGSQGRAFVVPRIPGLVILPGFVRPDEQRTLIKSCLRDHARFPNETNLDIHYNVHPPGIWSPWEKHWRHKRTGMGCASDDVVISPKATSSPLPTQPEPTSAKGSLGRPLINNPPASITDLPALLSTPKLPPIPASTAPPLPPSQLLYKLRWANIGRSYHWGTKSYDFSKHLGPFPEDIRAVCRRAVQSVPWTNVWGDATCDQDWGEEADTWRDWHDSYEPDAGIVNFYQERDTLMGHVDRSELSSTTPLVSISLGNAAIFLIGGLTRDVEPLPILLRSGDVVIMSGPSCRRAYHGVPRILEGTLPGHLGPWPDASDRSQLEDSQNREALGDDWAPFAEYMKTTRININVRQVFPRGFEIPAL